MPALVANLPKRKDKSSKSIAFASDPTKTASTTAAPRKRKHESRDGRMVEKAEEELLRKESKKLKGKEKVNATAAKTKPNLKVGQPEREATRNGKADVKERAKAPKSTQKAVEKKATGKKDLTTKLSKKGAESEMKKRKKPPTPSPEPSDADESEGDESVNEEYEEDEAISRGGAADNHDDESSEEQQNEAGPGSDKEQLANTSENENEGEDEDEEAPLHGFSSESDSSDEEEIEKAPIDVGKLPTVAKDDATVKRKLEKAKKQPVSICIHVHNIPF